MVLALRSGSSSVSVDDAVGVALVADVLRHRWCVLIGKSSSPSQTRSMMVATPMPPPTHSVARP